MLHILWTGNLFPQTKSGKRKVFLMRNAAEMGEGKVLFKKFCSKEGHAGSKALVTAPCKEVQLRVEGGGENNCLRRHSYCCRRTVVLRLEEEGLSSPPGFSISPSVLCLLLSLRLSAISAARGGIGKRRGGVTLRPDSLRAGGDLVKAARAGFMYTFCASYSAKHFLMIFKGFCVGTELHISLFMIAEDVP